MSNLPAPPVSWSDVARVCRRICVLRERGQIRDAELINSSLPELLFAVRTPEDTDAGIAQRLEALFSQEAERVANAAVLAELLAPMIAEQLPARGTAPAAVPAVAIAAPAPLPPLPSVAPRPPAVRAPSIADFIDEMIAQEIPPERSGTPARKS